MIGMLVLQKKRLEKPPLKEKEESTHGHLQRLRIRLTLPRHSLRNLPNPLLTIRRRAIQTERKQILRLRPIRHETPSESKIHQTEHIR